MSNPLHFLTLTVAAHKQDVSPSLIDGRHGAEKASSSFLYQSRLWTFCGLNMGTWRGLRVAFLVGSLLMLLLIIVYWDDVRGFDLYPLQDTKHESRHSDCRPQTTTEHSQTLVTSGAQMTASFAVPTNISSTVLAPVGTGGPTEKHKEDQRKEAMEKEEKDAGSVDCREQRERKQRIIEVCAGAKSVEFPGRTRAFEQIPNRELDHLIVDDKHRIIYCYVPKASVCVCVLLWVIFTCVNVSEQNNKDI